MVNTAFVDLLVKAVRERGVGLIVEAGPLYMPHKFDDRLDALLPVRLKRGVPGEMPRGVPSFHIELAPEGELHDSMRLYDDVTSNQNAWAQMPPYYWCAAAEKASPGATVLGVEPGAKHDRRQDAVDRAGVCRTGTGVIRRARIRRGCGGRTSATVSSTSSGARASAPSPATTRRRSKKSWLEVRPCSRPAERGGSSGVDGVRRGRLAALDPTVTVQMQIGGETGVIDMTADPNVKGRYTGKFTPKNSGEYRLTFADGQAVAGARRSCRWRRRPMS